MDRPGHGRRGSAWGELYGAVDMVSTVLATSAGESRPSVKALGETVWTYTALCQGRPTPWWHIDFPLLNYRVPAWMAWRDDMKGLLYWGGMSYWDKTDDPWTQAPYYAGSGRPQHDKKGIVFQGEGSLVYPARRRGLRRHRADDSFQTLRDAIQDYEYLAILDRLGKAAEAQKLVRSLTESFFQWEKDHLRREGRIKRQTLIIEVSEASMKK